MSQLNTCWLHFFYWDAPLFFFLLSYYSIFPPKFAHASPLALEATCSGLLFTQRRSVAKSVGCFQRRLSVCVFVCGCARVFVCQPDNFRTSRHRMIKLGEGDRCVVQNSRPSSNLGVIASGWASLKMWRWATTLKKSAQTV